MGGERKRQKEKPMIFKRCIRQPRPRFGDLRRSEQKPQSHQGDIEGERRKGSEAKARKKFKRKGGAKETEASPVPFTQR